MNRKVIWSTAAALDFDENLQHLMKNWSEKQAEKFVNDTKKQILNLSSMPHMGHFEPAIRAFKMLLVKQIYIFYEFDDENIYILKFWNNYKKPYW